MADIASAGTPGNTLLVNGNYTGGAGSVVALKTILNGGGAFEPVTDRLLVNGSAGQQSTVQIRGAGAGGHQQLRARRRGWHLCHSGRRRGCRQLRSGGRLCHRRDALPVSALRLWSRIAERPAYAPQSLVGNAGNNWDYRLQNVYVSPDGPLRFTRTGRRRRSRGPPQTPLPPTVPPGARPKLRRGPAYLSTRRLCSGRGLPDLDSLHRRLGEIRDDQFQGRPAARRGVHAHLWQPVQLHLDHRSFTGLWLQLVPGLCGDAVGGNWIARNDDRRDAACRPGGTTGGSGSNRTPWTGRARAFQHAVPCRHSDLAIARGLVCRWIVMGGLFDGP